MQVFSTSTDVPVELCRVQVLFMTEKEHPFLLFMVCRVLIHDGNRFWFIWWMLTFRERRKIIMSRSCQKLPVGNLKKNILFSCLCLFVGDGNSFRFVWWMLTFRERGKIIMSRSCQDLAGGKLSLVSTVKITNLNSTSADLLYNSRLPVTFSLVSICTPSVKYSKMHLDFLLWNAR